MSLYSDTNLPIPPSFTSLHEDELLSFARPGTWGTARQRRAIAAEARKARVEAGVQQTVLVLVSNQWCWNRVLIFAKNLVSISSPLQRTHWGRLVY